ncbi:hydrolase [Bacillus sp. FJAT-49736]|uniref:hydrolase n=1 Tax=Bacillus sp. FJAT-49736 TaxID=2833582 RepID=UPI001BC8F1EE|nr:hydrolase [Bacillus sp. FJAT-49736]MBS4172034.1 hydrolase [Bacillus sp. FJAT-49736]
MMNELFQFEQQWCMIHYPEKPNGFAIFILGDEQHFVNEETSFWMENKGRELMISDFTKEGYLVYYSNLFGRNWGNDAAVKHAYRLYQFIIRQEILNNKIHVLAEGMGALVSVKLMPLLKENIRSLILISPCLSLEAHINQEKSRKFFFKKLLKEIQTAFDQQDDAWLDEIKKDNISEWKELNKGLCIFQRIDNNSYKSQTEILKDILEYRQDKNYPTKFHYVYSDNQRNMTLKLITFLKDQEIEL